MAKPFCPSTTSIRSSSTRSFMSISVVVTAGASAVAELTISLPCQGFMKIGREELCFGSLERVV